MSLEKLSDEALFGRVDALARTERVSLVDLLYHLGELDSRPACQKKGFSSLFAYLTRHLGYAESDAIRRVRAARAARKYPSILRLLAEGELNLVGIAMIQPLLTSENHESLIRKVRRRSTREVERLVAELSPPAAGPRDRIRALPAPLSAPMRAAAAPLAPTAKREAITGEIVPMLENNLPLVPDIEITVAPQLPSSERRVVFTFTAKEEVQGWFDQARDLLRHRFPHGHHGEIIGDALRRLVEAELAAHVSLRPKRAEAGEDGRPNSRHIPKIVEDVVWRRDGGRCAYVGGEGIRCLETAWLELDHIVPWALGGPSDDPENIRLLCRAHNQTEAVRLFGGRRSH